MRMIDDVINYVNMHSELSPVEKQIIITRLDSMPSKVEIEAARELVRLRDRTEEMRIDGN